MNVPVNWDQKDPLPESLLMLNYTNVFLFENQDGDLLERYSPFTLQFLVFLFIPDNGHGINVSHHIPNVKCLSTGGHCT